MPLTRRQAEILAYISDYTNAQGYAPTLQEIAGRFGLSSVATVHKHVAQLQEKGYLKRAKHRRRHLEVLDRGEDTEVPLLGAVAAGTPIEPLGADEAVALPRGWLGRGRTYALRVRGESMIDEQIRDGDLVVVEERQTASNGETVVALVDGEAVTLKRYRRRGARVRLEPANSALPVMEYAEERVRVQGVVVGLLRRL